MDVGEFAFDDNVLLTDGVRGVDYITTFEVFVDGRAPGTCGSLVVGKPWVASAWPTIRAAGKAIGTDEFVGVWVEWIRLGDVENPSLFLLRIRSPWHDVAFAEGATGAVQITVEIVNGSGAVEDWLMQAELHIADSGLRAT